MDAGLVIQGSIQDDRVRHLQEDLNASREKYEKSMEEVQLFGHNYRYLLFQ